MFVVHPHLHRRRTGVTSHVEAVTRGAPRIAIYENALFGRAVDPTVPRVTLAEVLRRARSEDVVWHAHRNVEMMLGVILRRLRRRLRLVFTRHASHRPSGLTRWLMSLADRRLTLTAETADALALPSAVVPHGVDLEHFVPPADRDEAWRALDVGGRYGIGVVGRVREAKGQGDFVEAVASLLDEAPDWRAVLVGTVRPVDRDWAGRLKERTGGALLLAGQQPDVRRWYQGLTVLVQPSYAEGFGLTVLEGMATGCCVVATNISDFPSLIDHGRTGFLYDPGDIGSLRTILQTLLHDPDRARSVGAAAASEARERFGIEHERDRLSSLYREMFEG